MSNIAQSIFKNKYTYYYKQITIYLLKKNPQKRQTLSVFGILSTSPMSHMSFPDGYPGMNINKQKSLASVEISYQFQRIKTMTHNNVATTSNNGLSKFDTKQKTV